jgi:hypothetical protein
MMSIYYGVCRMYTPHQSFHLVYRCATVCLPLALEDVQKGHDRVMFGTQLEPVIDGTQGCTCRLQSSKFGDALGDQN